MERTARSIAAELLLRCGSAEQYSNIVLDTAIKRSELSDADRSLLTALVYGVIERQITLDYQISLLTDRAEDEITPVVRTLLRLGIYQLSFMDRIPMHAAVNETVGLAPRRAKGFVNAVLRAFCRGGMKLAYPERSEGEMRYLSVRYSFDERICERFVRAFGAERAETLLESFSHNPPLTLRVNTLKISREALLSALCEQGYDAVPTEESRTGIVIRGGASVRALPGFEEGWFFVQDEASQLCVEALEIKEGMTALDVCACPGSKSFGMAIEMNNRGEVHSCDLHQNKLSLVQSGAERLGISILDTFARDAREINEEWIQKADCVLCDVPCSGFGVFAKKPELRYKDPSRSDALPAIQSAILNTSAQYVREGGRLVYSTCTLLPRENEQNVAAFLAKNPAFTLVRMRTLTPDTDHTDGFFFAVMERT